ncbi:MAG TPA: tetratricopeptide repeat protein [Burkholderiales bacterium]|nr:tetratricopeptide repeat protein [Burkholderiales bacterium]
MELVRWLAATAAWLAVAAAYAQDALLDQARALLANRDGRAAYELLAPAERSRAGDPAYDLLLGRAALAADRRSRAIFAFERVLALRPGDLDARSGLAEAYLRTGEDEAARSELEALRSSGLAPDAAARVAGFLDVLERRERNRRAGASGFLEVALGHDSNVNAAARTGLFAIPAFAGLSFALVPQAQAQSDKFGTVTGGLAYRRALAGRLSLVSTGLLEARANAELDVFDTLSGQGSAGIAYEAGADQLLVAAQGQSYGVGGRTLRNALGGVAQWRRTIGAADEVTAFTQWSELRYPGLPERNAIRTAFGLAWGHAFSAGLQGYAGIYAGEEDAEAELFSNDLRGVRAGIEAQLAPRWRAFAGGSRETREHRGTDPLFQTARRDRDSQLRFGLAREIDREWSATATVTLSRNTSSIVIHAYERKVFALGLRYDLR